MTDDSYGECSINKLGKTANLTEKINCCFDKCDMFFKNCIKFCDNCYECHVYREYCRDNCAIIDTTTEINNPYDDCKAKYNKSETVQKCCVDNCKPTQNIDCKMLCMTSETLDNDSLQPYPQLNYDLNSTYFLKIVTMVLIVILLVQILRRLFLFFRL